MQFLKPHDRIIILRPIVNPHMVASSNMLFTAVYHETNPRPMLYILQRTREAWGQPCDGCGNENRILHPVPGSKGRLRFLCTDCRSKEAKQ